MKKTLAIALCLLALPAAAHPGHEAAAGFAAGFAHPLTGIDHLLAMLGVGLWSRQQGRGTLLPAFVVMMALGAVAQVGMQVEAGLAASVPAALVAGFALLLAAGYAAGGARLTRMAGAAMAATGVFLLAAMA
ncbi:HupE-UreJ family metal transporter [Massilia sp. CCM 8733]|uniref:HupE-UreJ family metal transporter n=2 Tax=Massilia mucilaginosa TaxID=2609282 RepID=A0ABX0NXJ3_9BURK|nr:HupE-UreJ family metal transporter [Massilia mucilaginosa]